MSNRLVSTAENVQRLRLDVNPTPGERIYYICIHVWNRILRSLRKTRVDCCCSRTQRCRSPSVRTWLISPRSHIRHIYVYYVGRYTCVTRRWTTVYDDKRLAITTVGKLCPPSRWIIISTCILYCRSGFDSKKKKKKPLLKCATMWRSVVCDCVGPTSKHLQQFNRNNSCVAVNPSYRLFYIVNGLSHDNRMRCTAP